MYEILKSPLYQVFCWAAPLLLFHMPHSQYQLYTVHCTDTHTHTRIR